MTRSGLDETTYSISSSARERIKSFSDDPDLDKVRTEMRLHVLAHNLKRVVAMLGPQSLIDAIRGWMILRSVIRNTNQPLRRPCAATHSLDSTRKCRNS